MKNRYKINLASFLVAFGLLNGLVMSSDKPSKTYYDTRRLLYAMHSRRIDSDNLATLFRVGEKRIADLVRALDDPERDISVRAQIVIRYLGSEVGMDALRKWYGRQRGEYTIAGPVPLPLSEWDYNLIELNFISKSPQTWGDWGIQYIYALALDSSSRAKVVLDRIINIAGGLDESTSVGYAIKRIRANRSRKPFIGQKDLARLVRANAFFVAPEDQKYMSTRLLGFNAAEDKALVEVYINRGRLAEEWYHVVLSRCESGWKFFIIDRVAIS